MAAKKTSPKAKAKTNAKKKVAAPAKKKKAAAPVKKKATKAAPAKKKTAKKTKAAAPAKKKTKRAAAPAKKKTATIARRDATGHLDKKYAADLRARSRASREPDDTDAFIRKNRAHDALAEQLGEEAVQTMTSAEDQSDQLQDAEVDEESGGPFVRTTGGEEYADGTDESNPESATREPFPRT
ncbi:MAG: hypothetical protein U0270_15400 [Labilithrix sp.]